MPPKRASIEITSPKDGAKLSSPLAIAAMRCAGASGASAVLTVGAVRHVLAVPEGDGVVQENVTLLPGRNRLRVELDGASHEVQVEVAPSEGIDLSAPSEVAAVETRATDLSGRYAGASCPAGVISVNGFMQQFATPTADGVFAEKIVLRPGANHVAVQIGELYVARLVQAAFAPAKILVTLVWDTGSTDVDLYVTEPSGRSVWYSHKSEAGVLDVDRTQGWGPENYSIAEAQARPGAYRVRVHYYADRDVGRTEWTARVIADEDTGAQQRRTFYGILDRSLGHQGPDGQGDDWNEVCVVRLDEQGRASIEPATRR